MAQRARSKGRAKRKRQGVAKAPTGIRGLDEITFGGLPRGRPTLVSGGPGCGKTLLAMQFILNGIVKYGEPGVFVAFEETADDLISNFSSLGTDLNELIAENKLLIDHIYLDPAEIEHTGAYDLEGLFVRLDSAIRNVGAKRIALDTVEALFSGLPDPQTLRAELRRMFRWLKQRNVTTLATGEKTDSSLAKHDLQEFVSDCVITLDHAIAGEILTRRLRIVKYRGSVHGTNSYPFLIDDEGLLLTPITSLGLDHTASSELTSSGIPAIDEMLGGKGLYVGSSTLVSGAAGTGKTSIAAHFVDAACRRGERAAFFAFEESPSQIIRNMKSIGIDLERWLKKGLLLFHAVRPTVYGLEMHLSEIYAEVQRFEPKVVVVDPVSNLLVIGNEQEANSMLRRLVDYFKCNDITSLYTDLSVGVPEADKTEIGISSLMDTWIMVRNVEVNGERNRGISVLKARGLPHSNQVRELTIGPDGVQLSDVYLGPEGVLTGSAREQQLRRETADAAERERVNRRRAENFARRKEALEAQIAAMRAELDAEQLVVDAEESDDIQRRDTALADRVAMATRRSRRGSAGKDGNGSGG